MIPPIYCVTLPEEPWKERGARKSFESGGIEATFIYGIHGVTIGLRPTNPMHYDNWGKPEYIHSSQIGCNLSHYLALSYAVSAGSPEFIICEDDVEFLQGFPRHFEIFRKALPDDAQIVQLAYGGEQDKPFAYINDNVARIEYPFCSACIWWKREAAFQALRLLRPIDRPFDIMLIQRVYPFFSHYVAKPKLAFERSAAGKWPSSVGGAPKE